MKVLPQVVEMMGAILEGTKVRALNTSDEGERKYSKIVRVILQEAFDYMKNDETDNLNPVIDALAASSALISVMCNVNEEIMIDRFREYQKGWLESFNNPIDVPGRGC